MAHIKGTNDDDQLYGSGTESDDIHGRGGNDIIGGSDFGSALYGDGGNDQISGGRSSDQLYGGAGADPLWGNDGFDQLYGEAGNDTLEDSAGHDMLDGGAGIDTVRLQYESFIPGGHEAVTYNFGSVKGAVKTPDGSTMVSIEQIDFLGSNFDDVVKGGALNDRIGGWLGNDTLNGMDGDDFIFGGNGNDLMNGGKGNDTLNGGGNDDVLIGGDGDDTLTGGNNSDLFDGHDIMEGGRGADHIVSGPGTNDLVFTHSQEGVYVDLELGIGFGGDAQGDTYAGFFVQVLGSRFNDRIVGGGELFGENGKDQLVASYSTHLMTGGAGMDTFIFRYSKDFIANVAHVADFDQAAHEILDVSQIDARPHIGNQAFAFIGTDAFSGAAGELRYEVQDGHTVVQMNADGNADIDFTVTLDGIYTLTANDFLL